MSKVIMQFNGHDIEGDAATLADINNKLTQRAAILDAVSVGLRRSRNRETVDQSLLNAERLQHKICCVEVCVALARCVPGFNQERFLKTCGVQS